MGPLNTSDLSAIVKLGSTVICIKFVREIFFVDWSIIILLGIFPNTFIKCFFYHLNPKISTLYMYTLLFAKINSTILISHLFSWAPMGLAVAYSRGAHFHRALKLLRRIWHSPGLRPRLFQLDWPPNRCSWRVRVRRFSLCRSKLLWTTNLMDTGSLSGV